MTSKKWTIIISTILSCISVVAYLFLQFQLYHWFGLFGGTDFCNNLRLSLMTISSGIFTGAFVTLLISIKEYLSERKKALERMYFAANDILNSFMKLKHFITNEPLEMVSECLGELDLNNIFKETNSATLEINPDIDSKYLFHYSYTSKKKYEMLLLSKMDTEDILKLKTLVRIDKHLDNLYNYNMKKYVSNLEKSIDSYLDLCSISCRELTIAYGNLDFLFGNKTIRKRIFNRLYHIIFETVNQVKYHLYDFNLYKTGKGDCKNRMCHIIDDLQKLLLREDDRYIYNSFCYNIDTEMVFLLKVANGNKDNNVFPDKKHFIIHSKVKIPNVSEENNA